MPNQQCQQLIELRFLCPTRHNIGHFGDVLPSQSLGLAEKLKQTQQNQTCIRNQKMYYNIKLTQKTILVSALHISILSLLRADV